MSDSFKAMWLGDGDPQSQIINEGGLTFVKGQAVTVPADLQYNGMWWADIIKNNPTFSVDDAKAEPVKAVEPDPAEFDPDAGTERGALKQQLRARGEDVRGNPSVETLRSRLAALAK